MYIVDGIADITTQGQLPLWHSAIFKNSKPPTYYCPVLIKKGVLIVNGLCDEDGRAKPHLLSKIAHMEASL